MGILQRVAAASILSIGIVAGLGTGGTPVNAGAPAVRVLHNGRAVTLLAPGASFTVLVSGLGSPRETYCLGLASLRDRYGLPVSLGVFRPVDDGLMAVNAVVPTTVFPAEPVGPFLLFAGHCTTVAPDGIYAGAVVTVVPAVG